VQLSLNVHYSILFFWDNELPFVYNFLFFPFTIFYSLVENVPYSYSFFFSFQLFLRVSILQRPVTMFPGKLFPLALPSSFTFWNKIALVPGGFPNSSPHYFLESFLLFYWALSVPLLTKLSYLLPSICCNNDLP